MNVPANTSPAPVVSRTSSIGAGATTSRRPPWWTIVAGAGPVLDDEAAARGGGIDAQAGRPRLVDVGEDDGRAQVVR